VVEAEVEVEPSGNKMITYQEIFKRTKKKEETGMITQLHISDAKLKGMSNKKPELPPI
jgi:hypothetical protein